MRFASATFLSCIALVTSVGCSGAQENPSDPGGNGGSGAMSGGSGAAAGAPTLAGSGGVAGSVDNQPPGNTNVEGLIGFAAADGHGRETTNGAGDGAPVVRVATFVDFAAAVGDATPRIVEITGTITSAGVDMVDVGSNKTIIGVGPSATIDGFGLDINGWTSREIASFGTDVCAPENIDQFPRAENVIVRNLTFVNTPDDSINVQCYSHHIWVDHNTFNVSFDGSVDVKRGSDLVTVSWNHFVNTEKTLLLGHSADNGEQDRGFLRVTYHHNWFDDTATRTPRVRFGYAHVFNNFLSSTDYFLGLGVEANIFAEANYVEKAKTLTQTFTESTGYHLTWADSNRYDVATITRANGMSAVPKDWLDADGVVEAPAYAYSPDTAESVPAAVQSGAGAGKI